MPRRLDIEGSPTIAADVDLERGSASHVPATSGATLLPRIAASLVSWLTQSTSLSLRLGTFIGGVALDGARATTLTGLELSRAVIEGILTRAGRDVAVRSHGDQGKAEAESLLERSLAILHSTVTSASFFAAATFHFSSTTLSSAAQLSQTLLSTLDAILGSTESSRAIAAIITLIRKELRETRSGSDRVAVGDLLVGTVGFALLQRWGRKNTQRLLHENGGDAIIWDVVILDSGARADVIGSRHLEYAEYPRDDVESESHPAASFMSPGQDEEVFDAVPRRPSIVDTIETPGLPISAENQHQISDDDIRLYIMKQLPPGSHASIRTDLVTARTITVDVFDDDSAEIAAPPGMKMIAERFHHDQAMNNLPDTRRIPRHTVVFRTALNRTQSSDVTPHVSYDLYDTESQNKLCDNEQLNQEGRPSPVENVQSEDYGQLPVSAGSNEAHDRTKRASLALHNQTNSCSPMSPGETDPNAKSAGKGPFTRFANKVKPGDKENAKWPSLKRPNMKPSTSSPAIPTIELGASGPEKELPQTPIESTPEGMPGKASPTRQMSSPVNRGLPRLPLQESSRNSGVWPAHSPTARNSRSYSARNSRNDMLPGREKNGKSYIVPSSASYLQSTDMRSGSPANSRSHLRSNSSMTLTRSEADMTVSVENDNRPGTPTTHRRSKSYSSSIYSLATAGSDTSLILAHRARKSAYEDAETIRSLNRDGHVPGIFPDNHFVQNIRRFCRFSSASYGPNALKVMGGPRPTKALPGQESDRHEHSAFSGHTGLPASTILLSSFVDPAGGSNAAGETESGFPLVHYLCIDHESKAVVLTLRGTWGFEDILTDMTCDYDDLQWQGRNWKVHKGMHASARRLLEGGGGRVMITIRAALEEFPDYGVVLCGHSLGGGVAALLATMISEPNLKLTGTSFVTASYQSATRQKLITGYGEQGPKSTCFLPPGRPIHVYAYGPPAVMSPSLRRATRGLITTIINGQDVVPSLSLGILHDMHSISLAFRSDASGAKSHVRYRVWEGLRQSIINKFNVNDPPIVIHAGDGLGEDAWAWNALKMLREEMHAPKLMPPGEVFTVETMRVLQRDAFTSTSSEDGYPRLGRPATRVQLKFISDAEALFGELRFGSGMLSDHNPVRYETSLAALARGILDE
ncbi:Lipase class 3 [Aspergillus sclerotialis]|uniref:sn-1-specific diacylglycerol lipase n=1 Tax=Aspergillus sclerotialis TaxID=2070753 RepID=A0A3A3A0J4_9EURO|nr:Lipase class 3 [Aspergillus sclerotialis]